MTANTRGEDCLTIQQRVESSEAGRALISAFVLVTLVMVLAINLPDSRLSTTCSGSGSST